MKITMKCLRVAITRFSKYIQINYRVDLLFGICLKTIKCKVARRKHLLTFNTALILIRVLPLLLCSSHSVSV